MANTLLQARKLLTKGPLRNLVDSDVFLGDVIATGGTITEITDGGVTYKVHTFTSSDTFTVTNGGEVEYLVVAGGGGGGRGQTTAGTGERGAGGGAGGYRTNVIGDFSGGNSTAESSKLISTGEYTVTIGAGGAYQETGNNSEFLDITSLGGGAGAYKLTSENGSNYRGANGGSGGGSMRFAYQGGSGTSGQGFDGGDCTGFTIAGGGGGAGGAGGSTDSSGAAGIGLVSSIDGLATERAMGGGVATTLAGSANLGEGGGGSTADAENGGAGGSGIVIIRYRVG